MRTRDLDQRHDTRVCVTIVTYNSRRFIGPCLEAVFRQNSLPLEVVVVDNASTDGTREVLGQFEGRVRLIYNDRNLGFAAGQNQAIASSASDWVLTLNPDVLLLPGFIERLVEAGRINPKVGTVCGRLLGIGANLEPPETPRIDSAGIYFTPAMRHFDRGWNEKDDGRFQQMEYVFGASAAAALYRREMIADVSEAGNFFDPDFFAYREDADVAWRAQLLGWRCIYAPAATAYHVRRLVPGNRRAVPAVINMHSVKNRFLMRIKNISPDLYWRNWFSITARDAMVVLCCLLWEHSSLRAFWYLARNWRRLMAKRRAVQMRQRVTNEYIASWFKYQPVSKQAPRRIARLLSRSQTART